MFISSFLSTSLGLRRRRQLIRICEETKFPLVLIADPPALESGVKILSDNGSSMIF